MPWFRIDLYDYLGAFKFVFAKDCIEAKKLTIQEFEDEIYDNNCEEMTQEEVDEEGLTNE